MKQQIPGAWNVSAFLTGYSGMTWNHSQAMKLGHDGKLSMFELYPGKKEYNTIVMYDSANL